ncbi:MAG: glutamine synthetase type III [Verrucomicrobia bacterium]|jgi:glutamine synthetase|nr:glutamine synthetase type III [Verrucomicrobiota bacterium]
MTSETRESQITDLYGENAFSLRVMQNYLSDSAFASLSKTIRMGSVLDASIADEVADAMKTWALEKGATHFTHWFQPLTGATAEKHDSFVVPDGEGGALLKFSGKELIQGEPDASSFPSGGLRATFEARGYTAWDPTSPAFIKEGTNGATLCIPTVFCGYHGEALDKKAPLLRSMDALSVQICRLGEFFGVEPNGMRACATQGIEQEYFLVDRSLYEERLDLIQTGRTLFGRAPAKHQQLDDHYFGAIKKRVITFMTDLDRELWRYGIPARTRHNEVCPAQFEVAPMFETLNLAVDHNMLMMETLRNVAEDHNFICLLHEKPYARVNGSGKHNNWSVDGPDGKNWLKPGDNPHENAKFLTIIVALMKAVDTHADLLRASVATAGNDHRLGANEAPPAIISIFLGEQLYDVIEQIEKGPATSTKSVDALKLGVTALPTLPRDATDRNRTSPFAYTGNKFEFRAVGSEQNCAGPNVILNTIVAEALDDICTQLDADVAGGKAFTEALQAILSATVTQHKRILFNGDNYTDEWVAEAERRGLPNLKKTPDALKAMLSDKAIDLFGKYKVLSEAELKSRYEVYSECYEEQVAIEARCAITMARTMIAPAALEYQAELSGSIQSVEATGIGEAEEPRAVLRDIFTETNKLLAGVRALEACEKAGDPLETLAAMEALREAADALEGLVPDSIWPLPTYTEMMFTI